MSFQFVDSYDEKSTKKISFNVYLVKHVNFNSWNAAYIDKPKLVHTSKSLNKKLTDWILLLVNHFVQKKTLSDIIYNLRTGGYRNGRTKNLRYLGILRSLANFF
jgi:hypothetical protein